MKDKRIIKAYRTAWLWPEVYSDSPSVIWTSRAIAFLVPLVLVFVTIMTGVPVFGWLATGFIAGTIGLVMVITTVKMFYQEFDSVEDFKSRETQIKEFFHGFPALTDVPVIENEPDEWIAYGHVEPQEFISAIQTVIREVTEDETLVEPYNGLQESVGHLYARFVNPEEGHWSEGIELCKPRGEGCFPITRITKTEGSET
jgi:low affinity Fe/Cu permease